MRKARARLQVLHNRGRWMVLILFFKFCQGGLRVRLRFASFKKNKIEV